MLMTKVPPNGTTPRFDSLMELPTGEGPAEGCHITRYGQYQSSLSIAGMISVGKERPLFGWKHLCHIVLIVPGSLVFTMYTCYFM